jgi:hypothetical protein
MEVHNPVSAVLTPELLFALIPGALLFPVYRIYVIGNLPTGRLPEDQLNSWYGEEARKDRFGDFLRLLVEPIIKLMTAIKS